MPSHSTGLLLAFCLAVAVPAGAEVKVPQTRAEVTLSLSPVVKTTAPAVVNIYAKRVVAQRSSPFANDPFFSQFFGGFGTPRARVQNSLGSGVIVDAGGIVVSNYHVVEDATDIRVVLNDRREFDGAVILSDPEADLAIIRLENASNLPALGYADSDAVEVGDLVLAIGNPFGVGQTVSSGIISGLARSGGDFQNRSAYFIQTDAAINPGNSGGALVDMNGTLVGINTSILTRSGGSNGIGFAIPANLVRRYVDAALAGQDRLVHPWSGVTVQMIDGPLAAALGFDLPRGVVVTELHPSSPFARAGLKAGDVITALDSLPVDAPAELEFRISTRETGAGAVVSFLRDGVEKEATVSLGPAPDDPPRNILTVNARSPLNGLVAANINPSVIAALNLPLTADGVAVLDARGYSARTRLQPGDIIRRVNDRSVHDTGDLDRATRDAVASWNIEFERNGQRAVIRIRG